MADYKLVMDLAYKGLLPTGYKHYKKTNDAVIIIKDGAFSLKHSSLTIEIAKCKVEGRFGSLGSIPKNLNKYLYHVIEMREKKTKKPYHR